MILPKSKKNSFMSKTLPDLITETAYQKEPRHIYTVSEITKDIKIILENTFGEVWVEGEVSGFSRIPTGTAFFNLKDSASLLKCVLFPSYAASIKFEIKDGMSLVCFGRMSIYEKEGKYQLYVQQIEPKGIGSLQLALEQLKQKLEKEGLFSPRHKRPIPYLPDRIGIVTSISGAAIEDILRVLERRFKDVHIIINPVRVQGEGAKEEIAQAIKDFNLYNQQLMRDQQIKVLIVGRGGGSIEDLWAFNEEEVARAIYNSKIPVISAVGHERDFTIADLVADFRASTPSVAAEMVLPKKEDLKERLNDFNQRLKRAFLDIAIDYQQTIDNSAYRLNLATQHIIALDTNQFNAIRNKLILFNPLNIILQHKDKIINLVRQSHLRIEYFIKIKDAQFSKAIEKLNSLSPLNILSRGYSITFKMPTEEILKDIRSVKLGDKIKTRLHKGEILSEVKDVGMGS